MFFLYVYRIYICCVLGVYFSGGGSHGALHRAHTFRRQRPDLEPDLLRREQAQAQQRALFGECCAHEMKHYTGMGCVLL